MKFELPALPYAPDALEPVISAETISFHWGKHEKAYIDTLNSLLPGTPYDGKELLDIVADADGKIFNNASQTWNHMFYFFQFSMNPSREPEGNLLGSIVDSFGSFGEFKEKFENAGKMLFGSGWVWLCLTRDNKLSIISGSNAYNPVKDDLTPIMVFDVWEHAYYLDYQNRRADYLSKLWDILDWKVIDLRYKAATE